jgi:hypothetical protein
VWTVYVHCDPCTVLYGVIQGVSDQSELNMSRQVSDFSILTEFYGPLFLPLPSPPPA